ncbi:recombination factor protein RarA [Pseudomonas prosekii]|uniref:replication-associated recombination protein A n=1 Tax=Pseudomonas prosekii TaxID=1148509 RepID=UPI000D60761A|nr:replication-associated recombination protein A [Pseudomonas prosekii]PWE38090.1 recombination factor protein RarA [Pseudomonas prosekii]
MAGKQSSLFDASAQDVMRLRPLAERMRPLSLDEYVGQTRLLGTTATLGKAIRAGRIHSMILWGPPGCGKTSLAMLMVNYANANFRVLSAVQTGAAEIRKILSEATVELRQGRQTILFVDEVHRFNKSQQDIFLPHVESGTIVLIGATTENPSFELTSALLSRCRVYIMDRVSEEDLISAMRRALEDDQRGLASYAIQFSDSQLHAIAVAADGDVRRAHSLLELACEVAASDGGEVSPVILAEILVDRSYRMDKSGDQYYDLISALQKSIRNSNPDAAVYWMARLLEAGCDPGRIARRLVCIAVDDIGLADPRAQTMVLEAASIYDRVGSAGGDLALAQAAIYLASTAKSNASAVAYSRALAQVRQSGSLPVPMSLRNAPTALMAGLGFAKGYQYDPDQAGGVALTQTCFPEEIGEQVLYQPTENGLELRLKEKLDDLRRRRHQATSGSGQR